eukprot:TRINITY_DN51004_c0_g1_i1.p1 TRINITY_DN51004_c0_g1~~TRINITY_DN51004_c0_g1_i1.p1  ORF type:complete len:253 (-),score=39.74 TRINITY_DN51004_c0_g1_i1:151-855(-)
MADLFNEFNVVCTKAEGRDKLARVGQYAARFVFGVTTWMEPTTGSKLLEINTHAKSVMSQLASARRTHRWCKEFPVIQSIPKSFQIADPVDRILEVVQKVSLATFMIVDHFAFLKQLKILKGGKRAGTGTVQLGLRFFCLSNAVSAIIQAKKLYKIKVKADDDGKSATERYNCAKTIFKHLLLVLQTAHLSLLYQTHDALVGFAGMISSYIDLMGQWPERKKVAAVADAQKVAK